MFRRNYRRYLTSFLVLANAAIFSKVSALDDPPPALYPGHTCLTHPSSGTCYCGENGSPEDECDGPDSCDCAFLYDCRELY
jgi:hypothetical protein